MSAPFYSGYRFPSDIMQRAIWLYLRFHRNPTVAPDEAPPPRLGPAEVAEA